MKSKVEDEGTKPCLQNKENQNIQEASEVKHILHLKIVYCKM